jgi:hypothetical protein
VAQVGAHALVAAQRVPDLDLAIKPCTCKQQQASGYTNVPNTEHSAHALVAAQRAPDLDLAVKPCRC